MFVPETLAYGKLGDPLYIEYIKRTALTPVAVSEHHFHDYYEVYVLLSGERNYFIKDRFYSISKGDLVFIDKNELHQTQQVNAPEHERLLIYFDERLLQSLYKDQSDLLLAPFFRQESHVLRFPKQDQPSIDLLISRIMTELKRLQAGHDIMLTHAAIELLLFAGRFLKQDHLPIAQTQILPIHKTISSIARFISDHYADPMSLNELAERFFISPYYLSRKFKETTGYTFTDYLNQTRVKQAQQLLRQHDVKIIDVAAQVGYDSFSHFGKIFKKIAGVSPRVYRKRIAETRK